MDVQGWLSELGLEQYAEAFETNAIDLEALVLLTDDDLKELGVAALGHRKKLLAQIAKLATNGTPQPASDTAIEARTSSMEGERRQVTVLFADITGFTKLSTELDPEETGALLNRYFEVVDGTVQSFGGTIDKHIGDAVMAVFGAPIAHSNDPERAVRAALEIHQAVKDIEPPITVHIGIASGQVVASGIGSDSHQEYTVTGDSVNLASRLQDMAKSGETFLSDTVHHGLAGQLECEDIGDVSIQGLQQPCGVEVPTGANFCPACGIRQAAAPISDKAGEQRQLTVMFIDLVGSTPMSERLDPEELGEVVRSYQARVTTIVEESGGTVAQYLGDGVLVYFGYPLAHEDAARRTTRAGLFPKINW